MGSSFLRAQLPFSLLGLGSRGWGASCGCGRLWPEQAELEFRVGPREGVVSDFLTTGRLTLSSASRNLSKQIPPLLEAANLRLWAKSASAHSREQFLSLHGLLKLWLVAAVVPLGTHFSRCNPPCHPPGDHQLQSYSQKQLERVTQICRTVAPRETLAPRYNVPCAE